jgi:predicted secreted protein
MKYAAFGAKLQYDNASTWTDIAGIRDISGPGMSADTVDVTTHDSTNNSREFLKTLIDYGEISFDVVFDPEETAGQAKLFAEMQATTSDSYRVVFNTTNDETWEFVAFVTGFEPSQPVEGEISASVTMKITGKPNFNPS